MSDYAHTRYPLVARVRARRRAPHPYYGLDTLSGNLDVDYVLGEHHIVDFPNYYALDRIALRLRVWARRALRNLHWRRLSAIVQFAYDRSLRTLMYTPRSQIVRN